MTVSSNNPAARHSTGLTAPANRARPPIAKLAASQGLSEWASSNKDFIRVFVAFTVGSTLLTVLRACSRPLPRVNNRPNPASAPTDDEPPISPSPADPSPSV
jgi:hypothetical protein